MFTPLPSAPSATPFASWAGATSPGVYQLAGTGALVAKTTWSTVHPAQWTPISTRDQTTVLSFNSAGDLADAYVVDGQATVFTTAAPDWVYSTRGNVTFNLGSGSLVMKHLLRGDEDTFQARFIRYVDPASIGLSYQTFGFWNAGEWETGDRFGGFSAGALTPGQAIPASGAVQFSGALAAYGANTGFESVAAQVTVNVDFGARTATFSSANFRDLQGTIYPGTALGGVLTYTSRSNALTGQLTSSAFTGPATGRFYGPAAEEIGGAFVLLPTDPSAYGRVVGGFGARR